MPALMPEELSSSHALPGPELGPLPPPVTGEASVTLATEG